MLLMLPVYSSAMELFLRVIHAHRMLLIMTGRGLEDGQDTEEDEDVAAERVRILGTPQEKLWESDKLIFR